MSFAPNPEQFMLAESVPPAQLVGQRVWVEGYGPGCVLKFEKVRRPSAAQPVTQALRPPSGSGPAHTLFGLIAAKRRR